MKCEKCGYESEDNREIKNSIVLCPICRQFAFSENLNEFIKEKADWRALEPFRKFALIDKNTQGMQRKAMQGKIMSRPALGYKLENSELLLDEEKKLVVQQIFLEFLNSDISLNQLARKFSLSVNGLKKVLRNFTYIGKVKFAGQIMPGNHQPIISSELFNKVQSKMESLGLK